VKSVGCRVQGAGSMCRCRVRVKGAGYQTVEAMTLVQLRDPALWQRQVVVAPLQGLGSRI